MIDIVFDEITRCTLVEMKHHVCENPAESLHISEIVCLGTILDIGPIQGDLWGKERRQYLQTICMYDEFSDTQKLNEIMDRGMVDYSRIQNAIYCGENIRVWNCNMAFAVCALALLCNMSLGHPCKIFILNFPENMIDPCGSYKSLFSYSHWGCMTPEQCLACINNVSLLTSNDIEHFSKIWRELTKQNTNLRILANGQLFSVDDSYYDNSIHDIMNMHIGNSTVKGNLELYSELLQKTGEYIHYNWALYRAKILRENK